MLKNCLTYNLKSFCVRIYLVIKYSNSNVVFGHNININKSNFSGDNIINDNCSINNSTIGYKTYVSRNCRILNATVGKFCSIAKEVIIGLPKHPVDEFISSHPFIYKNYIDFNHEFRFNEFPFTEIGNDVWIGERSIIVGDIKIGDGAIIAAGSVVTKEVAPYSIVGGVPAKLIRYRFSTNIVNDLKKMNWWDWSDSRIKNEIQKFRT